MINKKIFLPLALVCVLSSCLANQRNSTISNNQFSPLEQQDTKELTNRKFFTTLGSLDKEDTDRTLDFLGQENKPDQKSENKDKQNIWKETESNGGEKLNSVKSDLKTPVESSDKTKIIDSNDNFSTQKDQNLQKIVNDKEKDLPTNQTQTKETKIINITQELPIKADDKKNVDIKNDGEKNNNDKNIDEKINKKTPIIKYKFISQKPPIKQNDQNKLNQLTSDKPKKSPDSGVNNSLEIIKTDNQALKPKTPQIDDQIDEKAGVKTQKNSQEIGLSSWYGKNFNGQKTSSGELYQNGEMTAAHLTLPLNSIVKVTNLENGKSVKVRINDRGPFVKDSKKRIIDVSEAAAKELGFKEKGVAKVMVEVEQ